MGAGELRASVESVDATLPVGARLQQDVADHRRPLLAPCRDGVGCGRAGRSHSRGCRSPGVASLFGGTSIPTIPGMSSWRKPRRTVVDLRRQPDALKGTRLPNFEDSARDLVSSPKRQTGAGRGVPGRCRGALDAPFTPCRHLRQAVGRAPAPCSCRRTSSIPPSTTPRLTTSNWTRSKPAKRCDLVNLTLAAQRTLRPSKRQLADHLRHR